MLLNFFPCRKKPKEIAIGVVMISIAFRPIQVLV